MNNDYCIKYEIANNFVNEDGEFGGNLPPPVTETKSEVEKLRAVELEARIAYCKQAQKTYYSYCCK